MKLAVARLLPCVTAAALVAFAACLEPPVVDDEDDRRARDDGPARPGAPGGGGGEGEGEAVVGEGEGELPATGLEARTVDEVCGAWTAYAASSEPDWVPLGDGSDACDRGAMPAASQDAAIARVNLYRWLAGLAPVALAESLVDQQQACAAVLAGSGHLDHHPSQDAACYTPEGAQGAGSSNLAMGTSASSSVDLFVADNGIPSLGHRRWVLNPSADVTAFGYKHGFTCMYSFAQGAFGDPDFVAWPPPGPVPADAAHGRFSFATNRFVTTSTTRIEVDVDGAGFTAVAFDDLGWGYGSLSTTLAFDVALSPWELAGREVRVRIVDLALPDGTPASEHVQYATRFVACP